MKYLIFVFTIALALGMGLEGNAYADQASVPPAVAGSSPMDSRAALRVKVRGDRKVVREQRRKLHLDRTKLQAERKEKDPKGIHTALDQVRSDREALKLDQKTLKQDRASLRALKQEKSEDLTSPSR